ncbi:hypothetical protein SRB5_66120 [Streptomyces sp. RB5]|uniref:Serine/arginine repetitive matrix protein 2 n=1 Tax=Streptomyces smaragdinus TaxID=2585196 RepID=A0A7K0CSS7_9ACTN|nr:hypothetical protein [Streptomyces smaragdinus]MQY16413.1 hypothetical protein [Streptomyces smaragdinus]
MNATRPARGPSTALLVALAVIAVGAVGVLSWLLLMKPQDHRDQGSGPTPTAAGSAGRSTPPQGNDLPAGATGAPPGGYQWATDETGVLIPVPDGWVPRAPDPDDPTQIFYDSPDGRSLLQVSTVADPGSTPYDSMRTVEAASRERPDYRLMGLDSVDGEGEPAELEFVYTHDTYGSRHVLDRAFVAPDGNQYAVLVAGPSDAAARARTRELQTVVLDHFCVGEHCPAAG